MMAITRNHGAVTVAFMALLLGAQGAENDNSVTSPDGRIVVHVALSGNGEPLYRVEAGGETVIAASRLGLVRDDADFSRELTLVNVSEIEPVSDDYEVLTGKQRLNSYRANRRVFRLEEPSGLQVEIAFQVSNDGAAFRYTFHEPSDAVHRIENEVTSFRLPEGAKAWLQPMAPAKSGWSRTNPSYEEFYEKDIDVGTPSTMGAGWVFPALFRTGDNWVLLSETALGRDTCGSRLRHESPGGEYMIGFPDPRETMEGKPVESVVTLPWSTPWRLIAAGDLRTVMESNLGIDLADPAKYPVEPWMKPGRASWSWVLLKDDHTVFDVQQEFIDYAADMGWEYCLVDALWDEQIGYEGIERLVRHGEERDVGVLVWYNSNGDWNDAPQTPRDRVYPRETRLEEFARVQEMGVRGLKIDFFGGDGHAVMNYHIDLIEDAARHELLVNFHGTTLPRGWTRTYPNLMTMESARGFEFVTFDQANADRAPAHNAMLPFARNVFDPMDYTPVVLHEIPNIQRHTTNGHELALAVLYTSGIQHFAETPAGMTYVPDFAQNFLKDVPVIWDEMRFIDGHPGEFVVLGRRSGDDWYLAGINGENRSRSLDVDLSPFAGAASNGGYLIADGGMGILTLKYQPIEASSEKIEVEMAPNGGFVAVIGGE